MNLVIVTLCSQRYPTTLINLDMQGQRLHKRLIILVHNKNTCCNNLHTTFPLVARLDDIGRTLSNRIHGALKVTADLERHDGSIYNTNI